MIIININMNYLVSMFDCVLEGKERFAIFKNVKYEIESCEYSAIVFSDTNVLPFVLDLNVECENAIKLKYKTDNYIFLFPTYLNSVSVSKLNIKGKEIFVSCGSEIVVTLQGEVLFEKNICNLKYSHYEEVGDFCLIYFSGRRNFLVVLKDREIKFANYYDECNIIDNEKYFMCKLNDSLNHGLVCHIKDKMEETYLVYLDEEELKLKTEFAAYVFLDCVFAKNYKYCNSQLSKEIRLEDENNFKDFFPDFDFYYPLSDLEFVIFKKNTLAGIYKFEIENNLISNITRSL